MWVKGNYEGMVIKKLFIGILIYDQTYLQLFMWNNVEITIIYNIYKLVFSPCMLQSCNLDLWS